MPEPARPTRGASPRRALQILLGVAVALAAIELALRAAGAGDPMERVAARAGLDDFARYLAPDELVPGGWRTQLFAEVGAELRIPPRDGRVRVLLLGGANTSAVDEGGLQEWLNGAGASARFEVVNLGRPGFGSERLLILGRQAVAALRPDVVVLRTGHGEWIEPGLGAELAAGLAPLGHDRWRVLNVLAGWLEPSPLDVAEDGGPDPEPLLPWPDGHPALGFAGSERVLEAFRRDLLGLVDAVQDAGARCVLGTVAGNMLYLPVMPAHSRRLDPPQQSEFDGLRGQAHAAVPPRLIAGLIRTGPDRPPVRLVFNHWGGHLAGNANPDFQPPSAGRAAPVLRSLPDFGGIAAPWPDPQLWDPSVHALLGTLAAFHARDLTDAELSAVRRAADLAEQALVLDPGHAHAAFESGLYHYLAGDFVRAAQRLDDAAALDLRPNRGNRRVNGVVREVAAARPDVRLVDVDRIVREAFPDGITGYELFPDASSLHAGAQAQVARLFVPDIVAASGR
jgi:hypothetical protein